MTSTRPLVAALAVTATLFVSPLRADVSPGDKITDANMDKVKDLTSPGLHVPDRGGDELGERPQSRGRLRLQPSGTRGSLGDGRPTRSSSSAMRCASSTFSSVKLESTVE